MHFLRLAAAPPAGAPQRLAAGAPACAAAPPAGAPQRLAAGDPAYAAAPPAGAPQKLAAGAPAYAAAPPAGAPQRLARVVLANGPQKLFLAQVPQSWAGSGAAPEPYAGWTPRT